jgi:hypothetical protein
VESKEAGWRRANNTSSRAEIVNWRMLKPMTSLLLFAAGAAAELSTLRCYLRTGGRDHPLRALCPIAALRRNCFVANTSCGRTLK